MKQKIKKTIVIGANLCYHLVRLLFLNFLGGMYDKTRKKRAKQRNCRIF